MLSIHIVIQQQLKLQETQTLVWLLVVLIVASQLFFVCHVSGAKGW